MRYFIKEIHACGHCPNFRSEFLEIGPNQREVVNVCEETFNKIENSSLINPECPLPEKLSDFEPY